MSADCWTKKLADKSVPVRLMGAYRLAQMKGPDAAKARDAFAQYAGDKDLVVRNAILFGLRRVGDKSVLPALAKAKAQDEERVKKKQKQYAGAANALKMTMVQLENR